MIEAGVVAIIVWGALAFGAVYTWAYVPLLVACSAVGLLGLIRGRRARISRTNRAPIIALMAVIAAVAVELVPLPVGVLKALSPSTVAFLQQYDIAYALQPARHPLSIDPRATMLGLTFLAVFSLFLAGLLRAFARSGVRRVVVAVVVFGVVLALVAIIQKAVARRPHLHGDENLRLLDAGVQAGRAVRTLRQPQPFCGVDADGHPAGDWLSVRSDARTDCVTRGLVGGRGCYGSRRRTEADRFSWASRSSS